MLRRVMKSISVYLSLYTVKSRINISVYHLIRFRMVGVDSSLATGSEFKENYSYWTKLVSDSISLLGSETDSLLREVDTFRR